MRLVSILRFICLKKLFDSSYLRHFFCAGASAPTGLPEAFLHQETSAPMLKLALMETNAMKQMTVTCKTMYFLMQPLAPFSIIIILKAFHFLPAVVFVPIVLFVAYHGQAIHEDSRLAVMEKDAVMKKIAAGEFCLCNEKHFEEIKFNSQSFL